MSTRPAPHARLGLRAVIACLVLRGIAGAAIFNVNSTADLPDAGATRDGVCLASNGLCTLRAAIQEANQTTAADTIMVPAGTFDLTVCPAAGCPAITGVGEDLAATGDLDITKPVTIDGAGATSTIISAGRNDRVFDIQVGAGNITIKELTVANGFSGTNQLAGGIWNTGTLTLTDARVIDSEGPFGGGGILNDGTLIATNVTISGCSSSNGGALYNTGTATLTGVTLSGNTSMAMGGGIENDDTVTLLNVTLSGNTAGTDGGALNNGSAGLASADLKFVTIANNGAERGSGIFSPGDITLQNTILADSTSGDNCNITGLVTDNGSNLDTGTMCPLAGAGAGDISNTPAKLQVLGDNGGPTQTHLLLAGSPAVDAGQNCGSPSTDQRGFPRNVDGDNNGIAVCDIGAVESQGLPPTSTTLTSTSTSSTTSTSTSTPTSSTTSTSKTTTTSNSTSTSPTTSTSSTTSSTTSTVPSLCGNGIINPNETCGEPGLPTCGTGQLCLSCTCRQLGDCQDNGGTPNLFDVLEMIDILLQRKTADAHQMILCNVDCDTDIDLLDVLKTIDVVLQRIQPPLQCPH